MARSTEHSENQHAMSLAERAAFALLPFSGLGLLIFLLVTRELPLAFAVPWVPSLDLALGFRIDGLSALMLLLITGVGSAVFVYAGGYLAGHRHQRRVLVLLSAFMLAMIGAVTADQLLLVFVFWELTSLLSYLLVGFDHENPASRTAAKQAMLVTGAGGIALLAGLILLGQAAGTSSLSELVARGAELVDDTRARTGLVLVMLGCFTKSAQFPFHFWLPGAMSAPTPVSAYLHSATMVKLGVYLLARLDPAFGEWPFWRMSLTGVGTLTSAWAMILVLGERDLKRIFAWSTVSALGAMVMLVGLRGEGSATAVGAFMLAHALYKAPLFFVAGNVDHGTGTRDISRLGGLRRTMPFTATAAVLAAVGMAGLPLSFGYVAKAVVLNAKREEEILAIVSYGSLFVGAVSVAVAAVASIRLFFRRAPDGSTIDAHEGGLSLVLPPILVAAIGIVFGVRPWLIEGLLGQVARSLTPGPSGPVVDLELELGQVFYSVAGTIAAGAFVFVVWEPLHRIVERGAALLRPYGAQAFYERALADLVRSAASLTRRVQHGRGSIYAASLVFTIVLCVGVAFAPGASTLAWPAPSSVELPALAALLTICAGALLACFVEKRLVLLLASGLVGYGSALLFLFTGAPDLAFTQFAVETAFVIVVATVLIGLESRRRAQSLLEPRLRPFAALIALGFGGLLGALLLAVKAQPFDDSLSRFYAAHSLSEAHGRNVVNVIIVDFRGLDTLGESAVVVFSFLAALPLLAALRHRRTEPAP
jgi:multicomponent Na+:H+ antiporter subunit A